jgi:radical SAM superfamily enzyme YgiQ (UPF0313 family)
MASAPHILLVNPWIHDFAAYDFWAKPLGLLTLAALLREHGYRVTYIDCLDRFHPRAPAGDPAARQGRGPYLKTHIAKPAGLTDIPRHFSRYGIRPEWLLDDLRALPAPDLVLVTALMTYWYPGLQETVAAIRRVFGDVPVVLGGVYATLCREHAVAHSGADRVVSGAGEEVLLAVAGEATGFHPAAVFDPGDLDTYPRPALDLQRVIGYVPLLTARGCPFSCAYCAARRLNPVRRTRQPERVVEEIRFWHQNHGVADFVFYDDALLFEAETHALPLLEGVVRTGLKVRFHTPNALHIRWVTPETAQLMRRAGFETVRLGLETAGTDARGHLDHKVTTGEFRRAAASLRRAGFEPRQLGAYLLVGLPGQTPESVHTAIDIVKAADIPPVLTHYTPIPGTDLWPAAVAASRYDLASDPVFTNNAIYPCRKEHFSWNELEMLKRHASADKDAAVNSPNHRLDSEVPPR